MPLYVGIPTLDRSFSSPSRLENEDSTALVKHSGLYLLSFEDRFNV
jgi:hypothetical protein